MVLRRMDKLVEILNNDNLPEDRGPDSVAHGDWLEDIGLSDLECQMFSPFISNKFPNFPSYIKRGFVRT